jgi:16S rRNA (guanine527-N7)-methyltransferase
MGVPLDLDAAGRLVALLDRMSVEPQNLTAIDVHRAGVDRHLADSLSGLALDVIRRADTIIDLGSGGGFPGIPLAIACPECAVTLVESERRKAGWLVRAAADLPNVRIVGERAETLAAHERERWSVATARALGPLATALELAAPLVSTGGTLVVWRAARNREDEAVAERACNQLGFAPGAVTAVCPVAGAERHLHEFRKVAPTSSRFPRRPGRAAKRPLG